MKRKKCTDGCKWYSVEPADRKGYEWRRCNVPIEEQGKGRYPMPCVSVCRRVESKEYPCSDHKAWVDCYTEENMQLSLF